MIYKDVLKITGKRADAAPTQHEGLAVARQPYTFSEGSSPSPGRLGSAMPVMLRDVTIYPV